MNKALLVLVSLGLLSSLALASSPSRQEDKAGDVVECYACKLVLKAMVNWLSDGMNQQQIVDALTSFCGSAPAVFNDTCAELIKDGVPMVLNLLTNATDVDQACYELGMCDDSLHKLMLAAGPSMQCPACKFVVDGLKALVTSGIAEAELERIFDSQCSQYLPETVCKQVADMGFAGFVKLIKEIPSDAVCQKLGLCNN